MAEYIKLRLTAAKVGVSMAFFALLAGLAEKAHATPSASTPPPSANFLTDASSPGRLDRAVVKIDTALAKLEHRLATRFETTHKLNQTFLKIKSANTSFLKIDDANANFMKIETANANFLKIDDANANFLKIDDANSEFLKVHATAANSSELGGLTPDSFLQGHGNVLTNQVVAPASGTALLLSDGSVTVNVATPAGGGAQVTLANATSSPLSYTQSGGAGATIIAGGQSRPISVSTDNDQVEIQVLDPTAASHVWTITVSVVPTGATGHEFAGQMLIGDPS